MSKIDKTQFQSHSIDEILFHALRSQLIGRELICKRWRKPRVVRSVEFDEAEEADYAVKVTATTGETTVIQMWEAFKVKTVNKIRLSIRK